jgi:gamma-glutamylaminecyclotransferase
MRLFVYGTLRRGEPGHALLNGAPLLGEARTEPEFTLLDLGEYPAIVAGGRTAIAGELYEVEEALLRELDRYEDVPELYLRVERMIGGGPAVIYVLRTEHGRGRPEIASGDWLRRG